MVFIPVYTVDSLEKPQELRDILSSFEEQAKKIEGNATTPLHLIYKLEEIGLDGSVTDTITRGTIFLKKYIRPLLDFVFEQEEDEEALYVYKDVIGSDVVAKLSGDYGRKEVGTWKMTKVALLNATIPIEERIVSDDSDIQKQIMHTPTYTRQVNNSGFFNGKVVAEKYEEFKANPDETKRGLMLFLDLMEDSELQKEIFRTCQIPIISTYKVDKAKEEINKYDELCAKAARAFTREANKAEKEGREFNEDNIKVKAPKHKDWFKSLPPIIAEQVYELEKMNSCNLFNTPSRLMATPCSIHTLKKVGVPKECIREIKETQLIYGCSIKTRPIVEILSKYKIQLCVYAPKSNHTHQLHKYPSKIDDSWTSIEVDIYDNHMFPHKSYYCKRIKREVTVLRMLIQAFQYGLLEKFSAYELYENYYNGEFDAMIKYDHNEMIRKTPNGTELTKYAKQLSVKDLSDKRPEVVYFGDFECTTNESHHIPYMVHCIGPDLDKTYYGEDCAKQMLCDIVRKVETIMTDRGARQERIRIYFHNLKYDFTFIRKFLTKVKTCERGTKLYSAEGSFSVPRENKWATLEFWDTLPIMRCKLSKAANAYIDANEAKKFQKELCPYNFYTRTNFKKYTSGWVKVAEFVKGFQREQEAQDFLKILAKLPKDLYNSETDEICYMKYSAFYCRQDVVIMKAAFENIRNLFLGGHIEGINGTPPFTIDIYDHRTISSLAWHHFLTATYGHYFKDHPNEKGEINKENNCPIYQYSGPLRQWLREAGRGGRTMNGDNKPSYYKSPDPSNPDYDIVDYDAVSLYPSAGAIAWIPEGVPTFIKNEGSVPWGRKEFEEQFGRPEDLNPNTKYTDGCLHLTYINVKKDRSFPLLCIKDPKTKLNNYENFKYAQVDTIVSMVDLYNLIDLQDAEFYWDAAVVWTGKRNTENRRVFKELNEFRKNNHNLKDSKGNNIPDHPIAGLSKLVSNSIYGKTNQKIQNYETVIVDVFTWSLKNNRNGSQYFKREKNWDRYFNANAYRIIDYEYLEGTKPKVKVRLYKLDQSYALSNFAVLILAFSKRIIGPVIAFGEEAADEVGVHRPFYTDTDSVHLIRKTLPKIEEKFRAKFGYELSGPELGQFHIDFDAPANFKKDERVRGAIESVFCAKKIYGDRLLGDQGSEGFHTRCKGMCTELMKWDDFIDIYNHKPIIRDLADAKPIFDYVEGEVISKAHMIRRIMSRACREKMIQEEKLQKWICKTWVKEQEEEIDQILIETFSEEPPAKRQKI